MGEWTDASEIITRVNLVLVYLSRDVSIPDGAVYLHYSFMQ